MKKSLFLLFTFCFLITNQVFAYNTNDFSNDYKIIAALDLLQNNGEYQVFANMQKNAIKIKFYNLSSAGAGVYATNSYDPMGRRVILINSAYKDAPVEQIACLIAHESYHTARKATMNEETIATQKEAECWNKLKRDSVIYPQNKLTKRLNKLQNLYLASDSNNNQIQNKIASSTFYRQQFGVQ